MAQRIEIPHIFFVHTYNRLHKNIIKGSGNVKKRISILLTVCLVFLSFLGNSPRTHANAATISNFVDNVAAMTLATTDDDNMALGNPSGATTNIAYPNNYLMVKPQYVFSYNNSKHIPNWTSWHLDTGDLGSAPRQDDFRKDTSLPAGWYEVAATEYSGSGFDRGHMCPSADRTATIADNSATFLMDNMIPQAPNNNQITWANLENYERTLVAAGNELFIICGGYGSGGTGSNGYKTTVGNGVAVPAKTWKIIVVLSNGSNDVGRVTTSTRVIAVLMPNDQTCNSHPWSYYRTTVDNIESLTGYNFLSSVSSTIQSTIEARIDNGPTN